MERRTRCRHCRLKACEFAGMKPQYVTLDKKPTLLSVSDQINTQQATVNSYCQTFWEFYLSGINATVAASNVKNLAFANARVRQHDINITPYLSGTSYGAKISRIQHFQALLSFHYQTAMTIFDLLPRLRKFTTTSRDLILHHSFTQIAMLRIAEKSFDTGNGIVSWRGINGKIYSRATLVNMGLSEIIVNKGKARLSCGDTLQTELSRTKPRPRTRPYSD